MKQRRLYLAVLAAVICMTALAQTAKKEIAANPLFSASNYLAYPNPNVLPTDAQQGDGMTPPPAGYRPFYISHYGRHGSRYLIDPKDYSEPLATLAKADSAQLLTPLGKDLMGRLRLMANEADNRYGELTPLGARQHREIARRMYSRYPEVFAGEAQIDAKSTIVIRCILSMENALQELVTLNPHLRITHDASHHDMYYMNLTDKRLSSMKMPQQAKDAYNHLRDSLTDYTRLFRTLITSDDYISKNIDCDDIGYRLFKLASNLQSSPLGECLSLHDIFTPEELYANWQVTNAWWYINYGPSPLNGAQQPFSQRNLLRNIINTADSCIALRTNLATLRFGHETMVLPLTCLLGLNGSDRQLTDLANLDSDNWINYKIFPMGANIQFIFYRNECENEGCGLYDNILVKILLNENEATLPAADDIRSDLAPYYRWSDVRRHYLNKLDSYDASLAAE